MKLLIHTVNKQSKMEDRMNKHFFSEIAFAIIATLFLISISNAQPPMGDRPPKDGPMMSPDKMIKDLKEKLNLTDEQITKIEKLFEAQKEEMHAQMEQSENDREAMHAKMEKKQKEMDEKISSVLTADQKKKFVAMQKERREKFDKRRHEDE